MTAVTKKPQDARELKVHTAGEGDSLVQLTFNQKTASERSKAIDRYALARSPAFVREAWWSGLTGVNPVACVKLVILLLKKGS